MENVNISRLLRDMMGMPKEFGVTLVKLESLMSLSGYVIEKKAKAGFEDIVKHIRKLPKDFLDPEGGSSFVNLVMLANADGKPDKMQRWGSYDDAALLCLACQYYGIFQDPLHTLNFKPECLDDLPGKVSFVSFNIEDDFLELVRDNLGLGFRRLKSKIIKPSSGILRFK